MNKNKAIQNPENTCFNCLKETIVHICPMCGKRLEVEYDG
jgi:rRNA maturation endonuclease Nob1